LIPRHPKWPDKATLIKAVEAEMFYGRESLGFCLSCGEAIEDIEPDARGDACECCGEPCVYGAAEILMMRA
jgi:predicted amidophosphoribosyltransferase